MNEPGEVANNIDLPAIGTIVLGVLLGVILSFVQRSTIFGAR
jgi:hypothetical protein